MAKYFYITPVNFEIDGWMYIDQGNLMISIDVK